MDQSYKTDRRLKECTPDGCVHVVEKDALVLTIDIENIKYCAANRHKATTCKVRDPPRRYGIAD